jgi:hypothetical protein
VTIQDIDVALKIAGKNIAAFKGKTNRSKTNPVARDYVKVLKELLKITIVLMKVAVPSSIVAALFIGTCHG